MGNKKVLSKATRELNKTKRFAAPKNIIEDPRGQWAHPGEITRIPSDRITMQGVPYPVMAYPNMGEPQMMYPGQDYVFPGADYVDEYPQMKRGGTPKSLVKMPKPSKKGLASKKFSRSLEATNRLFTENPLFAKPKSKKRKVFDPNAQYQMGGDPGDKFKKRLMKRYPGMQGVYGVEGENLNIVKDPNYDARSAGYGDIEFTFPGDDPVLNYPNLVEEGGPDYNYPNPSPDKYTALYNPRGANRGDIFLDMMHGMRDDPNYQPLLQNFEKAVRDARGEDMDWYYDQQVKEGSTQSKERYDENYIDSQLRAELAPGSIGMFSKGRRDYRKDRKYDSPEMRAAAEDIRNYLKGQPAEEEYQEGGMTTPLDLDPKTMKKYKEFLKVQENSIKAGYNANQDKWYPHTSPEGGKKTIAYGHKLQGSDASKYSKGITTAQANELLNRDILKHQAIAEAEVDSKYGKGTFDSLPQESQMLLVDYAYNLGTLNEFPKFVNGVVTGNKQQMLAEHTRYFNGDQPLEQRNAWVVDTIQGKNAQSSTPTTLKKTPIPSTNSKQSADGTRDQWGRSQATIWYGFNPKTKQYDQEGLIWEQYGDPGPGIGGPGKGAYITPGERLRSYEESLKKNEYSDGGIILELSDSEIEAYRKGGYIIEDLETYPKGGRPGKGKKSKPKKVEPFVTSDPREYELRNKAYNDSLRLYKAYQMQDKLMGPGSYEIQERTPYKWDTQQLKGGRKKTYDPLLKGYYANDYQSEKDQFKKGYNDWTARKKDQQLIKYYKSLGFTDKDIMYHSSPDIVSDKIKAVGTYHDGTADSPIYAKPVQKVVFQPKPIIDNLPPEVSKSQLEKAGVIIGDKAIVGYEEVQQLDPKTGTTTTVINPVYKDLEQPIPTLHPTRVNPELKKFVYPENLSDEETELDDMGEYTKSDIESGIPDPGGHWEDKSSRYIDWDGNSIGFNGIRFRKPGHGGDLIRKGKRHYIHYPSIERRYDAWIEPDELPEEEYQEGGEYFELELTDKEIKEYRKGGWIVEEM